MAIDRTARADGPAPGEDQAHAGQVQEEQMIRAISAAAFLAPFVAMAVYLVVVYF